MTVLVVEDDIELARQLFTELTSEHHIVQVESNGPDALKAAIRGGWDLAIMDVSLPGMSGFEIVKRVRATGIDMPIIFLTAKSDVADRVQGLSLGGDDYLTKPFSMDELKARLLALTRRLGQSKPAGPVLPAGWKLNPLLRELTVGGKTMALQPREWSLLELFLKHEGEVLTKSFLLDRGWGIHFDPGTNVVDAMVCRLRRKLDQRGKVSHVETVRGRGYVFHRDV